MQTIHNQSQLREDEMENMKEELMMNEKEIAELREKVENYEQLQTSFNKIKS